MDGLSFLAVIFALTRIRSRPADAGPEEGGWKGRLVAGFAYVRGDRRARILLVLLGVCTIFGWSYLAMMPAFAKDVLHLDERGYGLLLSANGVGAALGALWVAGRPEPAGRAAIRRRVFGSLGLFSSMIIAFSMSRDARLAAAFLALAGFGAISFVSTSNTLIQLAVPDHLRGRVPWARSSSGSRPRRPTPPSPSPSAAAAASSSAGSSGSGCARRTTIRSAPREALRIRPSPEASP